LLRSVAEAKLHAVRVQREEMEARKAMTDASQEGDQDRIIEELRREIAARDEFIAVAAHELRNPMTPIVALVQLLAARAHREEASPALLSGLQTLETAVDHYVRRATTLLEITRVHAGNLRLTPSSFDLSELVQECSRRYELLAQRAGTRLECRTQGPVIGTWDRLAIEQVLDNLLSNAIRYGDGKPVSVKLDSDEDSVVLRVVDRGIGIQINDRERIFERFERATGARRDGGFGIGLWLTHRLVQAQAGVLELQSEVGAGSTFTVKLPRHIPVD
jgi:two-component system, OmpR family, sensor kinase